MSRHVRTIKPRFAPLVKAGLKLCTIRQPSKRPIKVGDTLSLRQWSGRPYGSKQIPLVEVTVAKIDVITIELCWIRINGVTLSVGEEQNLAHGDGFKDIAEFRQFFKEEYTLPFSGVLICWWKPEVLA